MVHPFDPNVNCIVTFVLTQSVLKLKKFEKSKMILMKGSGSGSGN